MRADIDQHVTAAYNVVVDERRISYYIVLRKNYLLTDLLDDLKTSVFWCKIFLEDLSFQIVFYCFRINTFRCNLDAHFINVCRKNFDIDVLANSFELLIQ